MEKLTAQTEFQELVIEAKTMIRAAQYRALQAVNRELINLYWELGKLIMERQAEYGWGRNVVESLARELQIDFPGESGFSAGNLWRIRNFYNETMPTKFSHHWCEKLAGRITCTFLKNAKTRCNASSTSA